MKYYIWLQLCLGQGNPRGVKALEFYKNAETVYNLSSDDRAKSRIFTKKDLNMLSSVKLSDAEEILNLCKKENIKVINYNSSDFPQCLKNIDNPPIVLYVKGELPQFDKLPSICIVGPRKVSDYGKRAAYSLSFRLAAAGFIVVSGGAVGTDTYVHAGALKAKGITALCLGCGILSDYLPQNQKLRETVEKCGCLISEYPPNTNASRYTFPVRNRIMSALTFGTVVIEAPAKSGALITAHHANDQGRDVFVVPGSPNLKEYIGSNALLRDGAKPLLDVSDIFNEYLPRFSDKINIENAYKNPIIDETQVKTKENIENIEKKLPETLSIIAKIVYNSLDKQKFYPEDIVVDNINSQQILSALTELEMEFLIKAVPGGMYEKI